MTDLHEVKETMGHQAEHMLDQLTEYFAWLGLPPRLHEIVDAVVMSHIFELTDPDKWRDAEWVESMRKTFPGYEEATSASIFLDEVSEHMKDMADHLTWIAAEIDGAHKKRSGCLENCPIIRRIPETGPGLPNLN